MMNKTNSCYYDQIVYIILLKRLTEGSWQGAKIK